MSTRLRVETEPRQAVISRATLTAGLALGGAVIFGMAAGWVLGGLSSRGFPAWLALAAPIGGLTIVLVGLLNYDALVLMTFCLIGYVRSEPAPFDLLLVVLLGMGLLTGRLRWRPSKHDTVVLIGMWGLIVANMLSVVGVVPIFQNLRFMGITLYALSLFCFVRMYATEPRAVRILLIGYTASAALNALAVVVSFMGIGLPIAVVRFSIRGVGFFKDPNVYAAFVVVAALWVVDEIVRRPFSFKRTGPLLILVGVLGAGATLSLSRAAVINLTIGGFIYFVLLRGAPRTHMVRFLMLVILVVLAIGFAIQFLGLGYAVAGRSSLQSYDEGRFSTQWHGLLAGLTHLTGVGPGGWANAHSLYVRTLAEHGILGLTSLGVLIAGLVLPLARRALRESPRNLVLPDRVLLAWVCGQLVNSLVIDSIHWRHFWVVLGLVWASLQRLDGEQR
jgi:hypothetical protein